MPKSGSKKTVSASKLKTIFFSLLTAFGASPIKSKSVTPVNFSQERRRMVDRQLRDRDIFDPAVLEAMERIPRHLFVGSELIRLAYADSALPIKEDQTISQPYIVALMTQSAQLEPDDVVLEIGTGSGYQAAILSHIVKQVYTIEIVANLVREAEDRLKTLDYQNVTVRYGDGYQGWNELAPFDAILITAAAPKIPQLLIEQLEVGGRMIFPLGKARESQELVVLTKQADGKLKTSFEGRVIFVPMTGEIQKKDSP